MVPPLLQAALPPGADVAALIRALAPELLPADPLPVNGSGPPAGRDDPAGWLARGYEEVLALEDAPAGVGGRARRRASGAFFTPGYLAAHVAGMGLAPAVRAGADNVRIIDPAMGSGLLLLAALRRLVAAGRSARAVATAALFGVDRDPVAVAVARLAIWLAVAPEPGALPTAAEAVSLRRNLVAGQALLGPRAATDGLDWAVAFPEAFGQSGGFDVLLANPPWGAAVTRPEREALRRASPYPLRGEVNTYALFLASTARWVRPGGWAAWIVPEGWLVNRNDEPLRRHLLATAAVEELAILRKGVFPAAPDAVPVLALLRPGLPQGRAQVRQFGFRRPVQELPALRWSAEHAAEPARWSGLPLAIFPVARSAHLEQVYRQVESLGVPVAPVRLSDGVYKTRLMPLLTPPGGAGRPALTSAAEAARYRVAWRGWTLGPAQWPRLPEAERQRCTGAKLIFHALKKPGAPHRVSCFLDPGEGGVVPGAGLPGGLVVSNNFVTLLPGPGAPDLRYLMASFNGRLLGRWYTEHFIQVNIEAFTLGAVPIRPVDPAPLDEQGAARLASWLGQCRAGQGTAALAGVEAELRRAGDGPVPGPVYQLVAEVAGWMQDRPDPGLDGLLDNLVFRLYRLSDDQAALLEAEP